MYYEWIMYPWYRLAAIYLGTVKHVNRTPAKTKTKLHLAVAVFLEWPHNFPMHHAVKVKVEKPPKMYHLQCKLIITDLLIAHSKSAQTLVAQGHLLESKLNYAPIGG